ncbi:TadE/TadG family type IV pilus assembly protein [Ruegeria atlantica]|uniref:TadE/TadG family type IV pilus assembly protein n=1 Tax=Ruegeria atlantica TaxID=81569 RepID=UPI00147FCA97|nr:TadE family protein [Ruegeria atlantica]
MTLSLLKKAAGFKRSERGSVTVEFALWFPLYMFFILGVIDYSMVSIQKAMLDRSMDLVVRDIRLGINLPDTEHDTIKDAICEHMVVMPACSNNLQLEMIVQDPYSGVSLPAAPDCVDRAEEAKPVREFSNGGSNALMIMRACIKFDPIIPTTAMGRAVSGDDGLVTLTATTTFVQEP